MQTVLSSLPSFLPLEALLNWIFSSFLRRSHSNKLFSGRGALRVTRQRVLLEALAAAERRRCHNEPVLVIVVAEWREVFARHSPVSGQVHCRADDTARVNSGQLWPIFYKTNRTCEIHCTGYLWGHHWQLTRHDVAERHPGAARLAETVKPAPRYLGASSAPHNSSRLAGLEGLVPCRRWPARRTPAAAEDLRLVACFAEQQSSAQRTLHTGGRGWCLRGRGCRAIQLVARHGATWQRRPNPAATENAAALRSGLVQRVWAASQEPRIMRTQSSNTAADVVCEGKSELIERGNSSELESLTGPPRASDDALPRTPGWRLSNHARSPTTTLPIVENSRSRFPSTATGSKRCSIQREVSSAAQSRAQLNCRSRKLN